MPLHTRNNLAVFYAADAYGNADRKMGRQQAGLGMLEGLIRTHPLARFSVVMQRGEDLQPLRSRLQAVHPGMGLHAWPLDKLDRVQGIDSLLVADPCLADWGIRRRWHSQGSLAWSLIGLTHTLSSHGVLQALQAVPAAPLHSWDALICTSRSALLAVREVFAHEGERLAHRFGGSFRRWQGPQLPIIPLGCDLERFSRLAQQRELARKALGIGANQCVFLMVGRLEVHAKAHPGVVLQALRRLSQRRGTQRSPFILLVLGTAQKSATSEAWEQVRVAFQPWFELRRLDGNDATCTDRAWAAGDVFVSMADSLQETFGLTPIEAMARGLPVIASDWDGYRDTVVHGETGWLIPTSQPPANAAHRLADLSLGRLRYDDFMADLMQQVVVDEDALLSALERLEGDQPLRNRLGRAGRLRAQALYGWDRVAQQIRDLSSDLAERREYAATKGACRESRLSPWTVFASWPSRHQELTGQIRVQPQRWKQRLHDQHALRAYAFFSVEADPPLRMPALEPVQRLVMDAIMKRDSADGDLSMTVQALRTALPDCTGPQLLHALNWLAKIGALELHR